MNKHTPIHIIGGGLAGSEAALQLAESGFAVTLYDQKPQKRSPAHHNPNLSEIVCSNSLGSLGPTASGLLKQELMGLNCQLLQIAHACSVPAGKALAVDRERFSEAVTQRLANHPNITMVCEDRELLPEDETAYTLLATGPLTTPGMAQTLQTLTNRERLYFFDAASPIIAKESIDFEVAFFQDRYNKGADGSVDGTLGEGSYINCPMNKEQYLNLLNVLNTAERAPVKDFEQQVVCTKEGTVQYFESCLPVEVITSRGEETLRFGPLKPVGLKDPRTEITPYAVVQLRQDNAEGTLYNMVGFQTNLKWGEQKRMIACIPGLEQAEVVRYGVMHRNTYVHSPDVLRPTLQLIEHPRVFLAGQLTGTEGYTEAIASGLMAAINIARCVQGQEPILPPKPTMLGALLRYITRPEARGKSFQPINSNWGILPPLEPSTDPVTGKFRKMGKKERAPLYVERSLEAWRNPLLWPEPFTPQAVVLEEEVLAI
jgi:methylenetetrahydrofolate--tRNA-(uracil-5-)-methyltransferase